MNLSERINLLHDLGEWIDSRPIELEAAVHKAYYDNKWFITENAWQALAEISQQFLKQVKIEQFVSKYNITIREPKTVGLIFAGNIPLVGFHDFFTVFLSGHIAQIKLSDKDKAIFTAIFNYLSSKYPEFESFVNLTERLKAFDAVIATGSDNTARQFEYYFKSHPKIIRKNRNAIGIIHGNEEEEDLKNLCTDICQYYGLGCRNISKLFVPQDYSFESLFKHLNAWDWMMDNYKYKNNYHFNYATFALNLNEFLSNGSTLLIEDKQIASRISTLHFERYDSLEYVENELNTHIDELQCVVSKEPLSTVNTIKPGQAQKPALHDYADNVDTMQFLLQL